MKLFSVFSPSRQRAALLAAAALGLFAAGPARAQLVVNCATDPANVFNTGTNGVGGILPNGTDVHWLVSKPGIANATNDPGDPAAVPAANWVPAIVATSLAGGAWRPDLADAAWIAQAADGTQSPDGSVDVFYSITFTLDAAVDPATFQLSMNFWADNSVAEVWVNGHPQSGQPGVGTLPQSPDDPYESLNFAPGAAQTLFTFGHDWQAGANTLIVDVKTRPGFDGFMAQFTAAPLCRPALRVSKTAAPPAALGPGDAVTYTVTAANTGAVAATGVKVTDAFPAGIASASWTCVDNSALLGGGPYCLSTTSGGAISPPAAMLDQTIATLPAGGNVVYTITATAVAGSPPASIVNTATANVDGGVCVDDLGQPTGQPMPCTATVANPPVPVVSITKAASTKAALRPGERVVYTIRVANTGTESAANVQVKDPQPPGIASMAWTCADNAAGALCPADHGNVALDQTLPSLPAGGVVTYTVAATLAASGLPAQVANIATVNTPGGACADGQAMPCPSGTIINLTSIPNLLGGGAGAASIPALAPPALALLALLLGGLAYWLMRRRRPTQS